MRFLYRYNLFFLMILIFEVQCNADHLKKDNSNRDFNIETSLIFILITTLSNNDTYCPFETQIPIYESGTFSLTMKEGEEYLFDIRARRNATYNSGSNRYKFIIQESTGQNIILGTPACITSGTEYNYETPTSQNSGQLETLYLYLYPGDNPNRKYIYSKLKCTKGSGTFTITIPGSSI